MIVNGTNLPNPVQINTGATNDNGNMLNQHLHNVPLPNVENRQPTGIAPPADIARPTGLAPQHNVVPALYVHNAIIGDQIRPPALPMGQDGPRPVVEAMVASNPLQVPQR